MVRSSYVLSLVETIPEASKGVKAGNTEEMSVTELAERARGSVVMVPAY